MLFTLCIDFFLLFLFEFDVFYTLSHTCEYRNIAVPILHNLKANSFMIGSYSEYCPKVRYSARRIPSRFNIQKMFQKTKYSLNWKMIGNNLVIPLLPFLPNKWSGNGFAINIFLKGMLFWALGKSFLFELTLYHLDNDVVLLLPEKQGCFIYIHFCICISNNI